MKTRTYPYTATWTQACININQALVPIGHFNRSCYLLTYFLYLLWEAVKQLLLQRRWTNPLG